MRATFDQIDNRRELVALTLGCTRAQAFSMVVLPEAYRGMLTAATLAWARALGEFGPLLVFAGTTRNKTEVLSTTVFLELSIGDLEAAVAVSLIMVVSAVIVLVIARLWGTREPVDLSDPPRTRIDRGPWTVIAIEQLTMRVGEFRLSDVSLEVPTGGYAALMGKTGSGKTTLLEAVAGLKHISAGRIVMHDVDVTRLKPAERNLGYVPQDGALFTGMTVRDHLAFALCACAGRPNPRSPHGYRNWPECSRSTTCSTAPPGA